jgi:hypothetical protein
MKHPRTFLRKYIYKLLKQNVDVVDVFENRVAPLDDGGQPMRGDKFPCISISTNDERTELDVRSSDDELLQSLTVTIAIFVKKDTRQREPLGGDDYSFGLAEELEDLCFDVENIIHSSLSDKTLDYDDFCIQTKKIRQVKTDMMLSDEGQSYHAKAYIDFTIDYQRKFEKPEGILCDFKKLSIVVSAADCGG